MAGRENSRSERGGCCGGAGVSPACLPVERGEGERPWGRGAPLVLQVVLGTGDGAGRFVLGTGVQRWALVMVLGAWSWALVYSAGHW